MKEITIKSTLDNSLQPSLFHEATEQNRPLLIGLHTWSHGRHNQVENMLPYAQKYDWNLLLPEFRGPNTKENPDPIKACGSEYAVQDIFDAIEYVCENYSIDKDNIFLLGGSGGGHMSLLATAHSPTLFKASAAFVPISDLVSWYNDGQYAENIAACTGGAPDEEHIEEYKKRSPITYLEQLSKANLKIYHGKHDPLVPSEQSVRLYHELFYKYPDARVYLDIFDGGHDMDLDIAFAWFFSQMKKKVFTKVTG